MDNFTSFLGYYVLGIEIPDDIKNAFYSSNLSLTNPDQYVIYKVLKNAPDLDDYIVRQLVIKILKDLRC